MPTVLEICAGAGGQALGFEQAGFDHAALVENDRDACATLRQNRPKWDVFEQDLESFSGIGFEGVDVIAGGVPCPPFSVAGKQLGQSDERDLFPEALRLVASVRPQAVLLENVRGLLDKRFNDYRLRIQNQLQGLGYRSDWKLLNASQFGVPQLRPRSVLVAVKTEHWARFGWPEPDQIPSGTVGEELWEMMASRGWEGASDWATSALTIAPTLVGGSKKHGGPDLGPTRARQAWAKLGVDGGSVAAEAPGPRFIGRPKLTVEMSARIQGFPDEWIFVGSKTSRYRQVGNAFPPPVAMAVGTAIRSALKSTDATVQKQLSLLYAD